MTRRWLLFAAAAQLAAPPAAAEVLSIAWDGHGRFERSLQVAPGKFVEACTRLPAGAKVRWAFEAGAPVDFNLHYHVGKDVVFPSQLPAVANAADTLVAKIAQDYCWMWSNKSAAAVAFTLKLQRSGPTAPASR